jgi:hypothetical protein
LVLVIARRTFIAPGALSGVMLPMTTKPTTMRTTVLLSALSLACSVFGQGEKPAVLRTDPYRSNGYFILDQGELAHAGFDRLKIEVLDLVAGANGTTTGRTIASFLLDKDHGWAHVERSVVDAASGTVYYRATGHGPGGDVVVYDPERYHGTPWPWVCNQVCVTDRYAWQLEAHSNGYRTQIDIGEFNAYFYVPAAEMQDFMDANTPPTELGLGSSWSVFAPPPNSPQPQQWSVDCFQLPFTPEGAHGPDGYPLTGTGPVWAIHKKKGPWRDLWGSCEIEATPGQICADYGIALVDYFNSDPIVQDHIAELYNHPGPLSCPGGTLSPAWEAVEGTDVKVGCSWIELNTEAYETDPDGNIDMVEHVLYVLHCSEDNKDPNSNEWPYETAPVDELHKVSGVVVRRWDESYPSFTLKMPAFVPGKPIDPRLIPVRRAKLPAGLYEVMIVMNDGSIKRHFEELTSTKTIGASFASFIQTNIYPVPVKDKTFAIDFDVLAPTTVLINIVDNMGHGYYTQQVEFTVAGRNKHVVDMSTEWPQGVYHAVFTYPDGSSSSKNFNVLY